MVEVYLWAWTITNLGDGGAEKIADMYSKSGVTDIYILVKATDGLIYYQKNDLSKAPIDGDDDPLEHMIEAAHAVGIRVHAWISYTLDSAYVEKYPDQGMYHFVRGYDNSNVSFLSEDYLEYMCNIVKELCKNYDIDGLLLDRLRYNHMSNGWGMEDAELLMRSTDKGGYGLSLSQYNELVTYLAKTWGYTIALNEDGMYVSIEHAPEGSEPIHYEADETSMFDAYNNGIASVRAFALMRCDQIDDCAQIIYDLKNENMDVSIACMGETCENDKAFAALHYGQILNNKYIFDYVAPMLYSSDFGEDSEWVAEMLDNIENGYDVYASLQAFYTGTRELNADINATMNTRADGFILFRTGMFDIANMNVDTNTKTVNLAIYDNMMYVEHESMTITVQNGMKIADVALGECFESSKAVISSDRSSVTITDMNLEDLGDLGSVDITYSGEYSDQTQPVFVDIIADGESQIVWHNMLVEEKSGDSSTILYVGAGILAVFGLCFLIYFIRH